jgi:hypothetical protein
MSVQKIIQESLNRNPLSMKQALEEELRARVAEAIAEKMEEVELDEAFEEGDKVHFQDEYGQKLHGHITKPFSAKKNGAKHAEVRLVGGMGTKMHVPHGQLKKVYEEVELDEISKKTLASYVDKAADNAALRGIGYGEKKAQSDEMDRMMNRHMSYSDKDKVRDIMKTSRKDVEEPREKMVKRLRGISTAAKKLSGGARVNATDK